MKKFILGNVALFAFLAFFPKEIHSSIVFSCRSRDHCTTCHTVLRNCFTSERGDIDNCVAGEEERLHIAPCLVHSHDRMSAHEIEAFMELENEDYLNTRKFSSMLQEIVNGTEHKALREINGEEPTDNEELSDTLKKHIVKLCLYANYHDNYDNAKKHSQGDVKDIEHNIIHIIKNFINSSNYEEHIQNFIGNPALCLKHPSDWVADRAHFEDTDNSSVGVITEDESELFSSSNENNPKKVEDISCNRDGCNRFLDTNECESQIRILDQGSCGNCWAFASSTVFQSLRCRKGYGFAEPSIKYITLCKAEHFHKNSKVNPCSEGGNMSQFLQTLDKVKVLPTSNVMPYDLPMNEGKCPKVSSTTDNLWEGVTLNRTVKNNVLFIGYLKFLFYDYAKSNKIEELIHILKDAVIVQGSVFITMRVNNILEYDHNGSEVMVHCNNNMKSDHAMTLIGFGSYTKKNGEASSYWIIRNSWGVTWADNGHFKLDMYGPKGCNGDVLSYAFIMNIDIKGKNIEAPLPKDTASIDLYNKHDTNVIQNPNKNDTSDSAKEFEKPKGPTSPERPKVPTSPERPKVPTSPERPKVPTSPEKPKVPTSPERPKIPTIPERPKIPTTTEKPKIPTTPEKPKIPATPEKPKIPATPEKPKIPTTPEKPKIPATPEKPKIPTTPERPKVPTTPERPKVPTTPERPKIPQSTEPTKKTTSEEVNPHIPFRGTSKPSTTDKPNTGNKKPSSEKASVADRIKQFENVNKRFA